MIATIDGGTTNTRISIWQDGNIVSEASAAIGVRNTAMDGNSRQLVSAIHTILMEAGQKIGSDDISLILAAGMLTSNVGIVEIPHITAPADMDMLAASMVSRIIPDISEHPIWFVPGIKNMAETDIREDNITDMDIMRGEETETAGILAQYALTGSTVLVLPGSHNKYIALDAQQRIQGCMTTLAGELLHSLTFDTILADTVEQSFADSFEPEAFERGVAYRRKLGIGHALFMARILDLFCGCSPLQAQNYLLGLLLEDDLLSLKSSHLSQEAEQADFIVAGKLILQQAYQWLLQAEGRQVRLVPAEQQRCLSGRGAIALAKRRGLLD